MDKARSLLSGRFSRRRVLPMVAAVALGTLVGIITGVAQPAAVRSQVLPLAVGEYVPQELLIKFKPGTSPQTVRSLHAQSQATGIDDLPSLGVSRMRVPPGFSITDLLSFYRSQPSVAYAEPNYLARELADPNDPAYLSGAQWSPPKVNAPKAWDLSKGSASVVIALVDSGIASAHEDLAAKVVAGYNFVDGNTNTADVTGHGTGGGGVAAATTNNGLGMAGLCQRCPLMPLRVVTTSGGASYWNIAQAIMYAADHGAKVINISLGASLPSSTLQEAVNYAWTKGLVLAAAAGNAGTQGILYPAAANNVIAVGATDSTDTRWSSSNTGPQLDVMAPGVAVYSTMVTGSYGNFSGTSISSPHVAALVGLIMAANPGLTNQQVVDIITSTAADLGPKGKDDQYGYGRIDAWAALQRATGTIATPAPTATATPTPTATATPTPTATATPTTGPALKTESFTGRVDARRGPTQANHSFLVAAAGAISASLSWNGGADLDLYLFSPGGQQVVAATGKGKPHTLSYSGGATGTYTLRVVAVSGAADYTLAVTHP